jgi:5-methylcytosine-specific restriction endonuclease McrA
MFGSDNSAIVKGHIVIDTIDPYHAAPADAVLVERSKSSVSDRFAALEALANDSNRAFILRYSESVFTNGRYAIPKEFAYALYNLQGGRCSIDGSALGISGFHLDHIVPLSMGGNNSLINLQICDPVNNIQKGVEVNDPRFCFSLEERIRLGLDTIFHERFSDRTLKGIKPNPDALYRQNLWLR